MADGFCRERSTHGREDRWLKRRVVLKGISAFTFRRAPYIPARRGARRWSRRHRPVPLRRAAPGLIVLREGLEARVLLDEGKFNAANGAVPLLLDDNLGDAFGGIALFVDGNAVAFGPVDERHHIGVLLDTARLSQVRELRPLVATPILDGAVELREGDDGNVELLG